MHLLDLYKQSTIKGKQKKFRIVTVIMWLKLKGRQLTVPYLGMCLFTTLFNCVDKFMISFQSNMANMTYLPLLIQAIQNLSNLLWLDANN